MQLITPIVKCNNEMENINLYIKREDLLPFSFGGNKVRIAEEYYADMVAKKKNCMIGYGNSRSNLCRVLANMSSSKNGECYIISPSDDDGEYVETNNSKLVKSCDILLRTCNKQNVAETVENVFNECERKGLLPYYIYGDKYGNGNEAVPVRAYAKVYQEIKQQSAELGVEFDYIFLATGTGMTQAGLIAGKKIASGKEKIVGISVAREKELETNVIKKYISAYANENNIDISVDDSIHVLDEYLCGGYGKYDERVISTIRKMYYMNGIPLDINYTGKAFLGMTDYIRKKGIRDKNILFIHTGGVPAFFDLLENKGNLSDEVVMLENSDKCKGQLINFLTKYSSEFAVPLLEKIDISEYVNKLLNKGVALAVYGADKELQGVVCGYANDFDKKVAYESLFVVAPIQRGSGVAEKLFEAFKKHCKCCGMEKMEFTTNVKNDAAKAFYKKMRVPIRVDKSTDMIVAYELEL